MANCALNALCVSLQGAKLAFVKPGIVAPAKRTPSADMAGTPPAAVPSEAAEAPEKGDKSKQEAHRNVIMQRLAAMKAVKAPVPVVEPRYAPCHPVHWQLCCAGGR